MAALGAQGAAGLGGAGKVAVVTGGNSGIGLASAEALCRRGFRVVLACRDPGRAEAARTKLRAAVPSAVVDTVALNLGDLTSVRAAARQLLDQHAHIDVLLNNAGVMDTPRMRTSDGFEFQLGVNYLGHFCLVTQLLPGLQAAGRRVRIINVTSLSHKYGTIHFDDLMLNDSYTPREAYRQSKLANVLFTYELARRLPAGSPITVNAADPGVVNTDLILRYQTGMFKWLGPLFKPLGYFLKTPAQGAATSVYLATSPDVEGVTGKYFADCKEVQSSPASYDKDVARQLWEVSEKLIADTVQEAVAS